MIDCPTFEEAAEELALGLTAEPRREELLGHASMCGRCRRLLADLGATVDALLELAPEVEPPVGFESRAVEAMGAGGRRRRPGILAAAAVAVVLVVAGAVTTFRTADQETDPVAALRTGSGRAIGRVELVAEPRPRVIVLVEGPDDWSGTWGCELRDKAGRWVEVGTWTAQDASAGVWSTPVDAEHLDARAMRITGAGGDVLATAEFD